MSRISSRGVDHAVAPSAPAPPKAPKVKKSEELQIPARLPEMIGFEASDAQLRARASFWLAYKREPIVAVEHLNCDHITNMIDAPTFRNWWADPNFRSWFLKQEGWREEAEFAFNLLLRNIVRRLREPYIKDGDLVSMGKLLADITHNSRASSEDTKKRRPELTDEEAKKAILDVARSLGWAPVQQLPPAGGSSK